MHYRRKYILSVIILVTGCGFRLFASDTLSFTTVESKSYNLYLQKDWKRLGNFCEFALGKGYDYYYLRVRAGIAYFEQYQYRKAAVHFEKAALFNASNFDKAYLYYCYLYSERFEQARLLSKSFDVELRSALKIRSNTFTGAGIEGGVKKSNDRLYNDGIYSQLSLTQSAFKDVSLLHAATYYMQDEWRFSVKQYQYFLQLRKAFKHNFLLSVAIHLIADEIVVYDTTVVEHLSPPKPPTKTPITVDKNTFGYVGAFVLTKHTALFDFSIGTTTVFLDTLNQYQLSGAVTWYPFKNNRLLISGNLYAHSNDNFTTTNFAVSPVVNFYITRKISLAVSYFSNANGPNITENNGYFVNNSIDHTLSRYTFSASAPVTKKIYIYGIYTFENKVNTRNAYTYRYDMGVIGLKIVL
ncbi:MAG: hypothetical protein H7296_05790 [Bacteroidia bacterium]|nr:hypothetical protein [Bacteroidia bacterium]